MAIVNIREYKLQSQPMLKQCLPSGVPGFSFEGAFQALKFWAPPTLFIKPHYRPPENSAESLRKFRGNLRKRFCDDPFANDRMNELLRLWQSPKR